LSPEYRILAYILFAVSLFFIKDITVHFYLFAGITVCLFVVPFQSLKKGWIPISILLLFTFLSNILFQQGKVITSAGPFLITDEGMNRAGVRTMRLFFMIAGAKVLTGTTDTEALMNAFGRLLRPLEKIGIPISEIFSTMHLTIESLPKINEQIRKTFREKISESKGMNFRSRITTISSFLGSLFIKSIQSPESFFEEKKPTDDP
jgi:energy-coupling factor transport system permease protein